MSGHDDMGVGALEDGHRPPSAPAVDDGFFTQGVKQVCHHEGNARLRSQLSTGESGAVDSAPSPSLTLTLSLAPDLSFPPSQSGGSTSGDVLAASEPTATQVYVIQRYDGAEYDNRGVAA